MASHVCASWRLAFLVCARILTMFPPGTTLSLKEPNEEDPYNHVEVVGQSPIQHATGSGSMWAGADAFGFIIRPLDQFGPTLAKPLGLLNELYEVEAWPDDPVTGEPLNPQNNPRHAPSPEQVLAEAARTQPAPPKRQPLPSAQDNRRSPEQVLRQQPKGKK